MNKSTDNLTRLSGIPEYHVIYRVYPSGLLDIQEWPTDPITGWVEPKHVKYRKLVEPERKTPPVRNRGSNYQGKLWV